MRDAQRMANKCWTEFILKQQKILRYEYQMKKKYLLEVIAAYLPVDNSGYFSLFHFKQSLQCWVLIEFGPIFQGHMTVIFQLARMQKRRYVLT